MKPQWPVLNGRRELICLALAAAEVSWVTPAFLVISHNMARHSPLLLWLGTLVLLLGFFYFYRALSRANLSLRLHQGLLVVPLLLTLLVVLRLHVYADAGLVGVRWLLQPFRSFSNLGVLLTRDLVAILALIYLWARGIHLARRNLSSESVGWSFRAGIAILFVVAAVTGLVFRTDASGFVVSYFFFAVVSMALTRVEEVSRTPGSGRAPITGFWMGSTLAMTAVLVLLGMLLAVVFSGGGVRQLLTWLSSIWYAFGVILVFVASLVLILLEWVFSFLPEGRGEPNVPAEEVLQGVFELGDMPGQPAAGERLLEVLQIAKSSATMVVIVGLIVLVLFLTWRRVRRTRRAASDETRESIMSRRTLARYLWEILQSRQDRLSDLVALVDRFGLGPRLLSAISIRHIYANLVRLATRAGYPRAQTQTPYEYLEVLFEVLPGGEADLVLITEAYVNAHYGQAPESREELRRIREGWDRIKIHGFKQR
jgi:hypothetical protein